MTYSYVSYMGKVFQGHLDPFRASGGPYVNLSQLASILGQNWPFWAPLGYLKGPWRPNMTYSYVSYMGKVFQGHLDPFRASEGPYVNFSQLASISDQKWPFLGPPWVPKRPQGMPI